MNRRQFLKGALASLSLPLLKRKPQQPDPEIKELDQRHIQSLFWWYLYTCRFVGDPNKTLDDIIRHYRALKATVEEYELFWGEEVPQEVLDEVRDKFSWAFSETRHDLVCTIERCECGGELITPWSEHYFYRDVVDRHGRDFPIATVTPTNANMFTFCRDCGKTYMIYYSMVGRREV